MKNKIILVLIVILVIFSSLVIYYGIKKQKDEENQKGITEPYSLIVDEEKKEINNNGKDNKEIYAKSIINDIITSYDYELIYDDNSIYGNISIENGYLYIYNKKDNISNKISNVLMKSLYLVENNNKILFLYALSRDGHVYLFSFYNLDIKQYNFEEIKTNFVVTNFTTLSFKTIYGENMSNLIVLAADGKLYELKTGIQYSDDIVSLNEQYYVYPDNTIANSYGNMIKDGDVYLKIKYYIETPFDDKPFDDIKAIIITDDNRLIYSQENSNVIFEYKLKVIDIQHKLNDSKNEIVKIILENGIIINFTGYCGDYYSLEK